MARQKLSPSEITKIKSYINKYEFFTKELTRYENELDSLENRKNEMLKELKKLNEDLDLVRVEEAKMNEQLVAKYGDFKLDLETFEITNS